MYECPVEGSLTRLMGIIDNYENLEKIGPVRSCRDYFVYWALEWDSIYCHFGGPTLYVNTILSQDYVNNLDGLKFDGGTNKNASVFYRVTDRKAPHNAYLNGAGIDRGIEKMNYTKTYTENYQPNHFRFAPESSPTNLSSNADAINAMILPAQVTILQMAVLSQLLGKRLLTLEPLNITIQAETKSF